MKKTVIVAVILVAVGLAAYLLWPAPQSGRRDVVAISGNVELTEVQVSFKIPGRIRSREVEEGAMVRQGDLVARLEDEDQLHQLEQARAEAEVSAAGLAELTAGSRREEIAEGEATLAAAQAQATRLEADLRRSSALYAKEVIPKRELDAARAASQAQQALVRERKEALNLLRLGARRERIDQARARYRAARAQVAAAQLRVDYATLTAPISGVVLSKGAEPGEQVAAGTPVVTLGDLNRTWLKGYIAETDLGRVKLGQRARVKTDSYPGKLFEGRVSFISSEAEFTPKNVQTEKERVKLVYRVKISLPNPRMELKPGMPADAEIMVGS